MAPTPITWTTSYENTLLAIFWATKKLKYSIDRPGMNRRSLSEALDDKIMGDIATMAVLEYLDSINIGNVAYDEIRNDNFQRPDPGWDIVVGDRTREWLDNAQDLGNPTNLTTISVKSSRIPRNDTLEGAINTRDFKIFQYHRSVSEDIKTNLELQVYYPYLKTQLNGLETRDRLVEDIRNANTYEECTRHCEAIYAELRIGERWNECNIVGYNDKESISLYTQTLRNQTWNSFGKSMWIAPLRLGNSMPTITRYR